MSNAIRHEEIVFKINSLFERAEKYLTNTHNITNESLNYKELNVGKNNDIVLSDKNVLMIQNMYDDKETYFSVVKDHIDQRFIILQLKNNLDSEDFKTMAILNIKDNPDTPVFIGNNQNELLLFTNTLDSSNLIVGKLNNEHINSPKKPKMK